MAQIPLTHAPATAASSAGRRRGSLAVNSSGLIRRFGLWAVLILVVAGFMIASSTFRQTINLENILEQNAIIGIVACGMLVMMIAGGFDLSVGAVGATSSVVAAWISESHGTFLAIIAGLAVGLVAGTLNGLLVAKVKINAFIATFAMASVVSGLLFVSTGAESKPGNTPFLNSVAANRWQGVPVAFIVFVGCLIVVWALLTRTRYGHYVYSVGGNAEASHLSGVPVQRVQLFAFILGGLFAAAGGLVLLGQTTIGQPSAATGWPLEAIAICVVAGVALTGGIGRAPDVLAATLLLGVIADGLNQLNISPYWQPTVTGLVILVAVTLDRYNRLRSGTSRTPATAEPAEEESPEAAVTSAAPPSGPVAPA
jgi:ribose/xylose/arabinose/galactoside ABC-type transport system permease subunit